MQYPDYIHHNGQGDYDLRAYSSLMDLLRDVWANAFATYDAKYPTVVAQDMATRAQDHAEIRWRWYHR